MPNRSRMRRVFDRIRKANQSKKYWSSGMSDDVRNMFLEFVSLVEKWSDIANMLGKEVYRLSAENYVLRSELKKNQTKKPSAVTPGSNN